jgi:chromosomal replication initiation ATPase DnaA
LSLRGKGERVEHDSRILGGGDFVKEILREADKRLRRQMKNKKEKDSIDRVIKKMCTEAGVKEEELRSGGKRRGVTKVRGEVASYLNKEMGLSMAEIARNLGVGTSAIGMAIGRMKDGEKK